MWNLEKWYRWYYLQSRNKRHKYKEQMCEWKWSESVGHLVVSDSLWPHEL